MVFSSNLFLFLFLPAVLLGYYLIRRELRNVWLLLMSLLFYAWGEPRAVFVMLASIALNYGCGLLLGRARERRGLRRLLTVFAVAFNLGVLFYYKYASWLLNGTAGLLGRPAFIREIALPIGISFFTFQGMSYVLDVARGKAQPQKNPLHVALYIALFPQLIAGPIVRYTDIESQLQERSIGAEDFAAGIRRFAVGLVKKAWLANTLGQVSSSISSAAAPTGTPAVYWLGILCYTFQIYFDFSGYSDMAIGLGRMFGFRFCENFDHPYIASSITEFWRRWHMSLSTWFRDYVYIPLGGSRRGNRSLHLLTVFFLTGLWHGASLNYVLWGLWWGVLLVLEKPLLDKGILRRVPTVLRWAGTMLLVVFGWLIFRFEDFSQGLMYLRGMFGGAGTPSLALGWYLDGWIGLTLGAGVLASLPWNAWLEKRGRQIPMPLLNAGAAALLVIGIVMCLSSSYNPFIYFRF